VRLHLGFGLDMERALKQGHLRTTSLPEDALETESVV
jgi:hypothetical protein